MNRRTLGSLGVLGLALAAIAMAALVRQPGPETGLEAPFDPEAAGIEFRAVDLFIDAGEHKLGAWQIEYRGTSPIGDVTLVGVEGGEHAAYAEPAFYDPAALAGGRIIVAAYSTAADLPTGVTRVARLHLTRPAGAEIEHTVRLIAAGDEANERLDLRAWAAPMSNATTDVDDALGKDKQP